MIPEEALLQFGSHGWPPLSAMAEQRLGGTLEKRKPKTRNWVVILCEHLALSWGNSDSKGKANVLIIERDIAVRLQDSHTGCITVTSPSHMKKAIIIKQLIVKKLE
jgi:hypothetical protein